MQLHTLLLIRGSRAVQKVGGGQGGVEAGGRDEWGEGVGVFDKEYQSAPVNCKADRLSVVCASRAKWAFSDFTSDHI